MLARVWGCRGSLPSPGASKLRYGGDTTCLEIQLSDGTLVIVDAGTGIRELGASLDADVQHVHLLLTHLHMDHVEGFPFFPLLWQPGVDLHVWGPASSTLSLKERLARYMSPPLFPVDVHDVPSSCTFHDLPTTWTIGPATVTAMAVEHPGPTVGYRFEEGGRVLCFMPDHEPAALGDFRSETPDWIDGFALAQDADVLLHDAQYTPDEYATRRGWGHSSYDDAVAYAKITGAKKLLLFHHDPTHDDDELEEIERLARAAWGPDGDPPSLAATGMTIDLTAPAEAVLR